MEARKKSSSAGSTNGEARMLERRVSNNRADLTGDQRMNYFLSWFQGWSDLQKSDFVTVLADKMSDTGGQDGVSEELDSMKINGEGKKPPSLYECQIKLFKVSFIFARVISCPQAKCSSILLVFPVLWQLSQDVTNIHEDWADFC